MVFSTPRVAVVGAGIGGLAAATALSRAGFRVDVYEQAAELRETGVGLHLGCNGGRILRRWGLAGPLAESGVRPDALEVRDWSGGRILARQPMGASWERRFGAPYHTIHRADLHRVLADQVPADSVRLNRRLTGFTHAGDQILLEFAEGGRAAADLLVGADGVHSVVRRAIAGPDARVFSGASAFRGLVEARRVPGLPAETMVVWPGPGPRMLCYPVGRGRLTFVGIVPGHDWDLESWSSPGDPADLAAAFEGWNPDVKAIVDAVTETRRWALYDRDPLPRWSSGRVTLLGDAAHPMLPHHGQGAGQAIEDAVALAFCLARDPGPAGVAAYEAVRRPHTTRVQLGSRGGGSMRLRAEGRRDSSGLAATVEDASWIQEYDVQEVLETRPVG
ncbi:FAD-dependent monooxygenase [Spirillospora sp. CA-294931]|uniref:FAD-dependent monooxygenase n=1 Tax=Spirillospora sp. CA-294931 TaxID=3240042 RepID=UPI003D946587